MNEGRSVRLFLADGSVTGIVTAEIMNWTGHVLSAPRTRLEAALKREELKRTGIYFLVGPDENSERPRVYVGESDEIAKRLSQHNRDEGKAFWETFIAVTSKDMNLTKAHVKYLEGRVLDVVHGAKKAVVENKDNPSFDRLPEADIADMESFLREIELVLPVIGADFIRRPKTRAQNFDGVPSSDKSNPESNVGLEYGNAGQKFFVVENKKAGIRGRATEIDGEFVVLSGSVGVWRDSPSLGERVRNRRSDAFEAGQIVKLDNGKFQTADDIAVSSPSFAAVLLFGTSRNGRTDWIVEGSNMTYGDWKNSLISSEAD